MHYASQLPKDQGTSSCCTFCFGPPFGKGGVIFCKMEVKKLKIVNLSNGTEIANNASKADTFFKRFKGLMFTKSLKTGHGLYIQPCRSIHTFFMNYPIDVLYLNESFQIVAMDETMEPKKTGKYYRAANTVLELPAGTIQKTKTSIGHYLSIK